MHEIDIYTQALQIQHEPLRTNTNNDQSPKHPISTKIHTTTKPTL